MDIFDDIQKSIQRQKLVAESFFEHSETPEFVKGVEEDIQKGKRAVIGEVRYYGGIPYRKVTSTGNANKDWVRVKDMPKKSEESKKAEEVSKENSSKGIGKGIVTVKVKESKFLSKNKEELEYIISSVKKSFKSKMDQLGISENHKFAKEFQSDILSFENKAKKIIDKFGSDVPLLFNERLYFSETQYVLNAYLGINQYDAKQYFPKEYDQFYEETGSHKSATSKVLEMIGEKSGVKVQSGMQLQFGADMYNTIHL